jgi:hypothetical protein
MSLKRLLQGLPAFLVIIAIFGCSPKKTVNLSSTVREAPRITTIDGDTILYNIAFNDSTERENFNATFKKFLNNYPFAKVTCTGANTILVKIIPVNGSGADMQKAAMLSNQRSEYVENIIHKTTAEAYKDSNTIMTDSIKPIYGGTLKLFVARNALDRTFSKFLEIDPFENKYGSEILTLVDSGQKKYSLRLGNRVVNGKNKIVSALDLIECWTSLIKNHPAEGFAIFRYVEGVKEYSNGQEAVVRGFNALDQYTVQIKLTQNDPYLFQRISTPRLLPVQLRLGEYSADNMSEQEIIMLPNKPAGRANAYLDKILLRMGGDVNPVLSFSLKKYDAVSLFIMSDLEYARNNLMKNSTLQIISADRYFIACNTPDSEFKKYLKNKIDAHDILKNFVKGEGEVIGLLETNEISSLDRKENIAVPFVSQNIKILFKNDDQVSKIIAEKLLSDLTNNNIPATLISAHSADYEKHLVNKNYTCAIGWIEEDVISDSSEKLRLASIWFNDELNESVRIEKGNEIPLFALNRYMLARNPLIVPYKNVEGLFINQSSQK